ncbi:putative peptidyl-tRNA hydrolase PTRHD1 [Condylostylus longicornis]|uniref:putative peptidyl-tRNA hydrolase PTRHD1 n=1 Tax=Condylostylus longicornis TaxID=2530218 RepID=UPI00244DDA3B|nr:putative peptidyl-tRNA hydrolase PTRHD1 [Condylostylus longicornis]
MSSIVQYVIVRGDLIKVLNWPVGAVIAQCCHATTAVTHQFREDKDTEAYFNDIDNMHKVILEAPDQQSIQDLRKLLEENDIKHKLWIEQPENIPTCIAVKPYPKESVHKYVKKFKLLK